MSLTAVEFDRLFVAPTLAWLGEPLDCAPARVMLVAIGLQESGLRHRIQRGKDGRELPSLARSFLQFERGTVFNGGGVHGVIMHKSTRWLDPRLEALGYGSMTPIELHDHMAWDATLAVLLGRALLWTVSAPLPSPDAAGEKEAWRQYATEAWRPGKPHRRTWPANWRAACAAVVGDPPGDLVA